MEGIVHLIIWLMQTRVVRSGSVTKTVRCENCTLGYEYELRRRVWVSGESSKEELAREAERRLSRQLEEESDLVPCPSCGWYQRHMVEQARRDATRKVPAWVVVVLVVTAVAVTFTLLGAVAPGRIGPAATGIAEGAGVVGAAGVVFLVLFVARRVYRRFAYNPNGTRWTNEEQRQ
jgi:hypothetical protein